MILWSTSVYCRILNITMLLFKPYAQFCSNTHLHSYSHSLSRTFTHTHKYVNLINHHKQLSAVSINIFRNNVISIILKK